MQVFEITGTHIESFLEENNRELFSPVMANKIGDKSKENLVHSIIQKNACSSFICVSLCIWTSSISIIAF